MTDIIDRLLCRYAMGPIMPNGEPEFGWRDFSGPAVEGMTLPTPIMREAAEAIRDLLAERDALRDALRWTAGVLQASCVAGKVTEADTARSLIGNETKSIGQILDAADAALAQERGTSNAQRNPD
ncbi:MAG: hypothetical protein AB7E12_00015 [Burkholderiaceae bacterium]